MRSSRYTNPLARLALVAARASGSQSAQPAAAQNDDADVGPERGIEVVQVNGLLDPANAALIDEVVRDAEDATRRCSSSSSTGPARSTSTSTRWSTCSRTRRCRSRVWVGPSGGGARGASALLALNAPTYAAVASGAGIGPVVSGELRRHVGPVALRGGRTSRAAQETNGRSTENVDAVVERPSVGQGSAPARRRRTRSSRRSASSSSRLDGQTVTVDDEDVVARHRGRDR